MTTAIGNVFCACNSHSQVVCSLYVTEISQQVIGQFPRHCFYSHVWFVLLLCYVPLPSCLHWQSIWLVKVKITNGKPTTFAQACLHWFIIFPFKVLQISHNVSSLQKYVCCVYECDVIRACLCCFVLSVCLQLWSVLTPSIPLITIITIITWVAWPHPLMATCTTNTALGPSPPPSPI